MCKQDEFEAEGNAGGVAAGVQCAPLTAEVRNHLQTCLVSVELLNSLDLPSDASRCAQRLERAVKLLVDGLSRSGLRPTVNVTAFGLFR